MRITKYNSMNDIFGISGYGKLSARVLLRISAGYVSKRSISSAACTYGADRKDSVGRAVFDHSRSVDRCSESDSGSAGKWDAQSNLPVE